MTPKHPITPLEITHLNTLLQPHQHRLLTPADGEKYTASLQRWSAAAVKPAGAVLIPESVEAVCIAVQYANDQAIDLAIKGGGHSTAGASSTTGGLCVDLGSSGLFTRVSVSDDKRIKVGGGATWGQVDTTAFGAGLVTVGGTVADTGVGGLTLGGGYGWLSGLLGLVIDNLLAATLVLADGTVVTATADKNVDLFWGVRGAGQNFGCVLEFVLQGYPYGNEGIAGAEQGKCWAGLLFFDPAQLEQVVETSNRIYRTDNTAGLCAGGLALARPPPMDGKVVLMVPVIYHGEEKEGRHAFQELLDLGPIVSTVQMVDYPAINHLLDIPPGLRVSMKGASFTLPLTQDFVRQIIQKFTHFTDVHEDARGTVVLFELYDPTQVVQRATNADAGFANRGRHFNGLIAPVWTQTGNDQMCRRWARDVAALFKEELLQGNHKTGEGVDGGVGLKGTSGAVMMYGNYDQYDEKSRDVFGANYPRLQSLKARYDPKNTFDKLFAVMPATATESEEEEENGVVE